MKKTFKTVVFFSVMVFAILIITMFFSVFITIFLQQTFFPEHRNPIIVLITIAVVSTIVGTIVSRFIGRRPVRIIQEISDGTKEIARGNFDFRLKEDIPVTELRDMAHNFNIMANELAGTELLRNDFVENVSHEFKTPLSSIEGYATLLQKKDLSEEKRLEYTCRILLGTRRLSALASNILLLSRLEHQEIEIKRETYSLDEQLRETILMLEERWTTKNIQLDIQLDTVNYYGNHDLLGQVWQNIFDNAVKFAPENGNVYIVLKKKPNTVCVSIADNGIGMSPETSARIFEKFYQGDTSHAAAGNGLGLPLAKRIVELHGGEISVSTKQGKGSTFKVSLPTEN